MKQYKVSVMQFGYVVVSAESKEDAERLAENLTPEQIHWYTEQDGFRRPYVITFVEEVLC